MLSEHAKRALAAFMALPESEKQAAWEKIAPKLQQVQKEIQREYAIDIASAELEWQREFGEPFPRTRDDMLKWAYRVGWDPEFVRKKQWTPADLMPAIEGTLKRFRDRLAAKTETDSPIRLTPKQLRTRLDVDAKTLRKIATAAGVKTPERKGHSNFIYDQQAVKKIAQFIVGNPTRASVVARAKQLLSEMEIKSE